VFYFFFFFQAEDGIRDRNVTGVQTCALPISKVAVMREFKNSEANHLGVPLPKGRIRFYKQDEDKQLEFTGENLIDHTPKDETLRSEERRVGKECRSGWAR